MSDKENTEAVVGCIGTGIITLLSLLTIGIIESFTFLTFWHWIQQEGLALPNITLKIAFLIVSVIPLTHPSVATVFKVKTYFTEKEGKSPLDTLLETTITVATICGLMLATGWVVVNLL